MQLKTDYCVTFMLVASNFAKNGENFKRELCLNVIIPFSTIACCLIVLWCSKNVFCVNRNREAQAVAREGTAPLVPRSDGTGVSQDMQIALD